MALDVPAPVGQVRDLAAQAIKRERQLHAVALDRAANLRRRARGHQLCSGGLGTGCVTVAGCSTDADWSPGAPGCTSAACVAGARWGASEPALTVSRILRASSIALLGVGGDPFLTARAAMK